MNRLVGPLAVAAALAAPATASAAGAPAEVTAAVGSETSISVAAPAAMTLTHGTPGTSTSVVSVTSTQLSWTLSIADQNTGAGAGHMVDPISSDRLASPLLWSADNVTFSPLSGAPATVDTGSLVESKTVYFKQPLGAAEDVTDGAAYTLTVAYTVS